MRILIKTQSGEKSHQIHIFHERFNAPERWGSEVNLLSVKCWWNKEGGAGDKQSGSEPSAGSGLQRMALWVNANKKNVHVTSCLEVCLSLSVPSLQPTAHKGGLNFRFQKEGHGWSAKILHSNIWPAETAKNGCSKTENDWLWHNIYTLTNWFIKFCWS